MASITRNHYFTVDMDKPLTRKNCGMLLADGDSSGDRICLSVMRNGERINVDGSTATAYFIRPDGITVRFPGVCDSNQIRVTLPQPCYLQNGCFSLAVKVEEGSTTATVAVLDGYIKCTSTGNVIETAGGEDEDNEDTSSVQLFYTADGSTFHTAEEAALYVIGG